MAGVSRVSLPSKRFEMLPVPRCQEVELLDAVGNLTLGSLGVAAALPVPAMYRAALPLPGRANTRFTMTDEDRGTI